MTDEDLNLLVKYADECIKKASAKDISFETALYRLVGYIEGFRK